MFNLFKKLFERPEEVTPENKEFEFRQRIHEGNLAARRLEQRAADYGGRLAEEWKHAKNAQLAGNERLAKACLTRVQGLKQSQQHCQLWAFQCGEKINNAILLHDVTQAMGALRDVLLCTGDAKQAEELSRTFTQNQADVTRALEILAANSTIEDQGGEVTRTVIDPEVDAELWQQLQDEVSESDANVNEAEH